jgi:hypothetical protein
MAAILEKKQSLGPGVTIYDFDIRKDAQQDEQIYNSARQLENSIPASQEATAGESSDRD